MHFLDNIFRPILAIIFTAASILFIEDISRIVRLVKVIIKSQKNLDRWKNGQISLEDIQGLTPHEFQFWCSEFISRIGYSEFQHLSCGMEEGKDIKCKFHGKTAYVGCKRYPNDGNTTKKINVQICNKLIGEMLHDGVPYGLLITSGRIVEECNNYLKSFQNYDKIQLIDGDRIIALYSLLLSKQQHSSI